MAPRTVVVLGGSGFVGRRIVARLASARDDVVVPTRRRDRARELILLPTVAAVEADIHDPAALARLVRGADVVVYLVGILNEGNGATFGAAHVDLARKVIAACEVAGVRRLVHMSALGADVQGPSQYLRSKGEAEAAVMASGLEWTVFRPSVIFGPDDRFLNLFARLARALPVIALASPGARFQPIWVGDVAQCFVRAIDDDSTVRQRYDLCGPKAYTLRELVRWTAAAAGSPRPILPLGPGLSKLQAFVLECLPGALMSRDNLASMTRDNVCDCAFPAVFGLEPAALEALAPAWLASEGMHDPYDGFRAHGGR